jgi:hypothetical protein
LLEAATVEAVVRVEVLVADEAREEVVEVPADLYSY